MRVDNAMESTAGEKVEFLNGAEYISAMDMFAESPAYHVCAAPNKDALRQ
jgi:hypothetical protein